MWLQRTHFRRSFSRAGSSVSASLLVLLHSLSAIVACAADNLSAQLPEQLEPLLSPKFQHIRELSIDLSNWSTAALRVADAQTLTKIVNYLHELTSLHIYSMGLERAGDEWRLPALRTLVVQGYGFPFSSFPTVVSPELEVFHADDLSCALLAELALRCQIYTNLRSLDLNVSDFAVKDPLAFALAESRISGALTAGKWPEMRALRYSRYNCVGSSIARALIAKPRRFLHVLCAAAGTGDTNALLSTHSQLEVLSIGCAAQEAPADAKAVVASSEATTAAAHTDAAVAVAAASGAQVKCLGGENVSTMQLWAYLEITDELFVGRSFGNLRVLLLIAPQIKLSSFDVVLRVCPRLLQLQMRGVVVGDHIVRTEHKHVMALSIAFMQDLWSNPKAAHVLFQRLPNLQWLHVSDDCTPLFMTGFVRCMHEQPIWRNIEQLYWHLRCKDITTETAEEFFAALPESLCKFNHALEGVHVPFFHTAAKEALFFERSRARDLEKFVPDFSISGVME